MKLPKYAAIVLAVVGISSCVIGGKYTVGGTVAGLEGSGLVLEDNAGDSLEITADGAFAFSSGVANAAVYTVTVSVQPSNPAQTCTVHNGTGTIDQASIVNVVVNCTQAGRFAYVVNQSANDISAFVIDPSSGVLTPIAGSPFASTGISPQAALVDPNGVYLYVVNFGSNNVSVYSIDYDSGVLTPAGVALTTGNAPTAIAIDPANHYLYVTNSVDDTVSAFSIENGVGTPLTGSPYVVGNDPFSLKTDPGGNFLYVTNFQDGTVTVFAIDAPTGTLTAISGSPFGAGAGAVSIAIDPAGTFAYVANETDASISSYAINSATGALTPVAGSPLSTATNPEAVTVNPGGSYLYAANVTSLNDIAAYAITPNGGALTLGATIGAGAAPLAIAIDPLGAFAYAANDGSADVSVFTVDAATGALTAVPGSPFPADGGARSIAID